MSVECETHTNFRHQLKWRVTKHTRYEGFDLFLECILTTEACT